MSFLKIEDTVQTIPQWYSGRSILITGATGFMGKVLMEKLLRSTPDIDKLYILVRPKCGLAPSSRLEEITKLPIFQPLRETNPQVLKKIVLIEGDVAMDHLGISEKNRKLLHSDVSVVFHGAATIKLFESLKTAVKLNLKGTENVLELCKGMKKLKVVVHISTTYCHDDIPVLEEKVYPSPWNPKEITNMVSWMDDRCLDLVSPGILQAHPYTYSLTKRLSETVVGEYGKELPVTIVRPSLLMPAIKEPLPGWVDTVTGPVAVIAGIGKGIIRSFQMDLEQKFVMIPVDTACNATIIAAWYRGTRVVTEIPVYNLCLPESCSITWKTLRILTMKAFHNNPFDWPLLYPNLFVPSNVMVHKILICLFQILPAYLLDFIFILVGKKRYFVRIQQRIAQGRVAQQYCALRGWNNNIRNFKNMPALLCEQDRTTFDTNMEKFNIEYMENIILGIRKFLLKEDPKTLPRARTFMKFLYVLNITFQCIMLGGFIWTICMLVIN